MLSSCFAMLGNAFVLQKDCVNKVLGQEKAGKLGVKEARNIADLLERVQLHRPHLSMLPTLR